MDNSSYPGVCVLRLDKVVGFGLFDSTNATAVAICFFALSVLANVEHGVRRMLPLPGSQRPASPASASWAKMKEKPKAEGEAVTHDASTHTAPHHPAGRLATAAAQQCVADSRREKAFIRRKQPSELLFERALRV